jgi:hypothetical protein
MKILVLNLMEISIQLKKLDLVKKEVKKEGEEKVEKNYWKLWEEEKKEEKMEYQKKKKRVILKD